MTASDGRSAVEFVQSQLNSRCPLSAILMDLNLPVMDGFSATAAIRALGYTGPIIAVTATATPASRDSSIIAGVDDYVTNPFSGDDIRSVLERHLLLRNLRESVVESELMWE